ncbi:phosphoribosyltransferase [Promicromonospora sp. MS192]|uniref:phosphoribosyltransferase n=1 Tax=Promicromonospora sp. MS192 TaxID=3412684 RepID=UPI003C2ED80E
MATLRFVGYLPDSRGNRIDKHVRAKFAGDSSPRTLLCLLGPREAVAQIEAASEPGTCSRFPVRDLNFDGADEYNFCLDYPAGIPAATARLVELLTEILTLHLPPDSPLQFATALDFYKSPREGVDPMKWPNTDAGAWVNAGKYWSPGESKRRAMAGFVPRFTDVLASHPLYSSATTVVSVPGHNADGRSWGEKLARRIARETDKKFVETLCPSGPRKQMKGADASPLPPFEIQEDLSGEPVIVVDDVYKTGRTMAQAAHAARAAGAPYVSGFVIARTLSN